MYRFSRHHCPILESVDVNSHECKGMFRLLQNERCSIHGEAATTSCPLWMDHKIKILCCSPTGSTQISFERSESYAVAVSQIVERHHHSNSIIQIDRSINFIISDKAGLHQEFLQNVVLERLLERRLLHSVLIKFGPYITSKQNS